MKTPSPDSLLTAAEWCESCQGEDREEMKGVAKWLRHRAAKSTLAATIRHEVKAIRDYHEKRGTKFET